MTVKPFRLISKSEREHLVESLRRIFETWQDEWFAKPRSVVVTLVNDSSTEEINDRAWVSYRTGPHNDVAISLPDDWRTRLKAAIAGGDAATGAADIDSWIAPIVGDRLLRSLATALLQAGTAVSAAIIEMETVVIHRATPDAGEIVAQCMIGNLLQCWLRLSPKLVNVYSAAVAVTTRPTELVPIQEAMANERVSVEVVLGEAELTLEELRTLGVGDVVRLDRLVDRPLSIRSTSNITICAGYLGTTGERKAVQLTTTDKLAN